MSNKAPINAPEADTHPGPDVLQVVKLGLRRSRKWLVPLVVIGTAVGAYFALAQQNSYTSEAKLLLRAGSRERVSAESLVSLTTDDRIAQPTAQAEIAMLQDQAIYERVARTYGPSHVLEVSDPTRDDGPGTPWYTRAMHSIQAAVQGVGSSAHVCTPGGCQQCTAMAAEMLRDNVHMEADRDSNVILVTYTANSPERARAIAQELVAAFIDRHSDQFSVEPILEKNRPKLEAAKQRRDEAALAFFEHVRSCGIVDLEVQRRVLIESGAAIERDYNAAVLRRDEIQAERTALGERMKASSAQIDLVRERAPNPVYIALRERVQDLDVEAATNAARLERLSFEAADHKTRLESLRECEKIHAALGAARDLEAARCTGLLQRYTQLEDLGSIDLQTGANLLVLQQPTLNFRKDGPKRGKTVLAAFAFSLLFGVWLASMRELFDRRLRHGPMVESQLGVRLLGTIPEYDSRELVA